MKTLFFKEVALEELNSHGTDFWTGVGIGTGVVGAGRSSWCTNCCDVMDMNKIYFYYNPSSNSVWFNCSC